MAKIRYIMSFDTEDDGRANPYLYAFVSDTGSVYFEARRKSLSYLERVGNEVRKQNGILEVWATNLEYDLVNLFGIERIREIELVFGKSYLVGANWAEFNIVFRDTIRHIPASVKALGEMVGLKKIDHKHKERKLGQKLTQDEINYCIRDATITYRTAKFLHLFYSDYNIQPKTTLPATALHIWKDRFWKKEIELPDSEVIEFARNCYFGGRTEAFSIGTFKQIKVIDAASMYPWAMINGPMPIPWTTFKRVRKGQNEIEPTGLYEAEINSKIKIPVLPIRTSNGNIFPNGNFTGYFVGEEIIYAKSLGVSINVLSGFEFHDSSYPFNDYVENFFAEKQKARGSKRVMYKLLLNSLYGKFGQKGDHIIAEPIEEFRERKEPPEDFRIWNGLVLYEESAEPPPWGNVVWSAIICARARIRLHKEMMNIVDYGGRPLYCDTDSVAFISGTNKITYPEKVRIPGEFEKRGEYKSLMIVGKKEYILETMDGKFIPYCKGVPEKYKQEYLVKGKATYVKPTRIRESSRVNIPANIWKSVTKQRHTNYNKRNRNSDGSLAPIVYNERRTNNPNKRGQENGKA